MIIIIYLFVVSRASPSYAERVREGLGNRAHLACICPGIQDTNHIAEECMLHHAADSCGINLVTANRINTVSRLGGCTQVTAARAGLTQILASTQYYSDSCAAPDVHDSRDPLSLFRCRRGWRVRLMFLMV